MKETIDFSDWEKLDVRVGEIIEVEDIEGADKLYKLTVDFGEEIGTRTICAGIKEYISKENLKGKKAIFLVNLASRKLRGIESEGMILASENENGNIILLVPEKDISKGSKVS
tara:strand:+ start:1419 stop:1757 length:339 start_codon:yes stop_codon:yes gene_type:complete